MCHRTGNPLQGLRPNVINGGEFEQRASSKTFICPVRISSQTQNIWKQMSPCVQQQLISLALDENNDTIATSFESHVNQEFESKEAGVKND